MPISRRGSESADEEQQQPRKNQRRGKSVVNYAEKPDEEKMKEDDSSDDMEAALDTDDDDDNDEEEEFEDEVIETRRSARVVGKRTNPSAERRVSTRASRARSIMQDDDADDDEGDLDGDDLVLTKKKTGTAAKSPARSSKMDNRLGIESLTHADDYVYELDDEDDESLVSKKKPTKLRPKKNKERQYEPFRIARTIAVQTLPRSAWKDICREMNTSAISWGSRWKQELDSDDDDGKDETRYLIKWNDLSFAHCSWENETDLEELVKGAKVALSHFYKTINEDDGKFFSVEERNDGEYFDPAWLEVDRILEVHFPETCLDDYETEDQIEPVDFGIVLDRDDSGYQKGLGRQFLIKWGNRPYSEKMYEYERDLILLGIAYKEKVKDYMERSRQKPEATRQKQHATGEAEFRRLYKEVFGEKSDSKVHEQPELFQRALEKREYPNGGQLRSYQAEGISWLLANYVNKRSCILADEMGLGKTIQVVAFLDILASKLFRNGPFLVVAPLSTLAHWLRECVGWTNLNTIVYHGSAQDRSAIRQLEMACTHDRPKTVRSNELYLRKCANALSKVAGNPWMAEVVITTPEVLCADDFMELTAIKWECIIVDEAHKLKNRTAKLSTNLRDRLFHFKHKILLTGTPIQNTMEELFALLNFVDPVSFDDCDNFMGKYGDMKSKATLDELHEEIRPYILRRLKEDVEKCVPPKEETVVEVEMTVAQKQYYRALYEKNVKFLHKNKKKAVDGPGLNNLAMQLRKCCNHLFLLNGIEEEFTEKEQSNGEMPKSELIVRASGKLVLLDKLLPRLKENGHRILVFSQFKTVLDILERYMEDRAWKFERIDGSITGLRRQQAIDRFQALEVPGREQPFIMLLSTRAGGVGITLTAADTCIIFDSDWNPQNDLQAQARCHRIGQTKNVKVYRLLTRNTYEQHMFHKSSMKMGLDQAVLSGFEAGKDAISKEEVERLLRLGAYGILNEDIDGAKAASDAFMAQDIDTILERNSHIVVHEGTGSASASTGGKFSKARFAATKQSGGKSTHEDIAIDDPDFWKKMLGDPVEDNINGEVLVGKRNRTINNYSEQDYDKRLLESHDLESGGDDDDDELPTDDGKSGDDESFEEVDVSESESEDEAVVGE